MENLQKESEANEVTTPQYEPPFSDIVSFDRWLESIGKTQATGWRWRRRQWINTINISGRVYVRRSEIRRFEERASAGEFSKTHSTPARTRAAE